MEVTCVEVSFETRLKYELYKKETPTQMFSCEYCNFFGECLQTAASGNNNKKSFLGKATGHNDHYMINLNFAKDWR